MEYLCVRNMPSSRSNPTRPSIGAADHRWPACSDQPAKKTKHSLGASLGLLALAVALGASGCAKRYRLNPTELERVKTEAGVQPLRVYTNKRLVSLYDEANVADQFKVQRKITESEDKDRIKDLITKNTAGLILAIEELNGAPLLWVTFDPSCREADCAYGFVETEDKGYRLVVVPEVPGFEKPRSFRGIVWKKRRLRLGKLSSLAEANEVYLVKKRNGKILTVDLEVKKVVDKRVRTRRQKQRGID
jgi:hypothetical protein